MHLLSPTDQKCADSSKYWQFFHYRPPGELRYTAGPIAKILCKDSIYIYILTLSIFNIETYLEWHSVKICSHSHYKLIYNVSDYLYLKNQRMRASNLKLVYISSTWDCTTFHNFLPMLKKIDFQKLAGLWLAGEVVNHVRIYGSKVAEDLSAFQRRSCSLWPSDSIWWCWSGSTLAWR